MNYATSLVPRETLPLVWPVVAPLFVKAVEYADGRETLSSVCERLMDGRAQLWAALTEDETIASALVTSIVNYSCERTLRVELCGGRDVLGWKGDMQALIERFARDQGATRMEIFGRPGWKRRLAKDGWTEPFTILEKKIEPAAVAAAA